MDSGFAFKIGDVLRFKSVGEYIHVRGRRDALPKGSLLLFVLERRLQECPGGVQRHYVCRMHKAGAFEVGVVADATVFNEVEVELAPLPVPEKEPVE